MSQVLPQRHDALLYGAAVADSPPVRKKTLCVAAGYSVWTNSSFKAPLISSAIACILGNTLYCIGYDCKWLSVLMAARLVTGLGTSTLASLGVLLMDGHLSRASLIPSYHTNAIVLHPITSHHITSHHIRSHRMAMHHETSHPSHHHYHYHRFHMLPIQMQSYTL